MCVVKIARLPEFNRNTEQEQRTLVEVRQHVDAKFRESVPTPFGVFHSGNLAMGVETVAPGQSLLTLGWSRHRTEDDKIDDLRLVEDWTTRFHQQPALRDATWTYDDLATAFKSLVANYFRCYGQNPLEVALFIQIYNYLGRINTGSIPVVLQHTDLGPWNIYRSDRHLTIIDWEFGNRAIVKRFGPPGLDFIWFATHWSYAVRKLTGVNAERKGFRDLFIDPDVRDRFVVAARGELATHLRNLSIDLRLYPVLLTYIWIWHALNRWERWSALGTGSETIRSEGVFRQYIGLLAEETNLPARLERFLIDTD